MDSAKFAERQKAARELARLGERAGPALRRRLEAGPSAQMRKVISDLLKPLGDPRRDPEVLRAMRAVEALERMATPDAVRLLERLAADFPEAVRTTEAKAAVARLAGR